MKKLTLSIALFLACLTCRGAAIPSTIWYALTNFNVTLATNAFKITPVSQPMADGKVQITGLPIILYTTNGVATNKLFGGFYQQDILGISPPHPIIFNVYTNDPATYSVVDLAISGLNTYVVVQRPILIAGANVGIATNGQSFTISSTGGGGGGGGLSGNGSPQNVVSASPGTTYYDITGGAFYMKTNGVATTTGWSLYLVTH